MNLIKFLKENKNARKIFGKSEIKIIEKQLSGIALTQSEKNRLSRDIRKKLEFIKEISKFENEFELKKSTEIKNIIHNTIEIIKEDILFKKIEIIKEDILFKKIKKIILFGSAAENKLTFRSDIDIAIEFSETNLKEATEFRVRISGKAYSKVDIQVYNLLQENLKKEIDEKGRILYIKR